MQIEITPEYLASQGLSETFPERFWKKVNKNGPVPPHKPELGQCWLWTGSVNNGRYGNIVAKYCAEIKRAREVRAHVGSWLLHNGPIPEGLRVCHHCDVCLCVRPDHLWLGTQAENMADMVEKGRGRGCPGESHSLAKLTWKQVEEIRQSYNKSLRNGPKLAAKYGVSKYTIYDVVNHVIWNR